MGFSDAWIPTIMGLLSVGLRYGAWEGTKEQQIFAVTEILKIISAFPADPCQPVNGVQPQEFNLVNGELEYRLVDGDCSTLPEFRITQEGMLEWRPIPPEEP